MFGATDPVPWFKIDTLDAFGNLTKPDAYRLAYYLAHMLVALYRRPLPDSVASLARKMNLVGHEADILAVLEDSFTLTDAGWINPMLVASIERSDELRRERKKAGAKGGKQKAANRLANAKQPGSNPAANAKQPGSNGLANAYQEVEVEKEVEKGDSVFSVEKTGTAAPSPAKNALWAEALPALMEQGMGERAARRFVGMAERDYGTPQTLALFRTAINANATDITAYVRKHGKTNTAIQASRDDPAWAKENGFPNKWEALNAGIKK